MQNHDRRKLPLLFIAVILFAVLIGWITYQYGLYRAGFNKVEVRKELTVLQASLQQKDEQIESMRNQLARLESAQKVDTYATRAVKHSMERLQQENQALREELQFYRGIVSPSLGRAGVHIQNFKLDQGEQEGQYHYKLTLIHIQGLQKHHREASGRVLFSIEGEKAGTPSKLEQAQILPSHPAGIRFRVRYFGRFEGRFTLPSGYKPNMIRIEVKSRDAGIAGAEKEIKWPQVAP